MMLQDKVLLRKRGMIESVLDCLKDHYQGDHPRHRSVANAFTYLIAGLAVCCHRPNKPSLENKGVLRLAVYPELTFGTFYLLVN